VPFPSLFLPSKPILNFCEVRREKREEEQNGEFLPYKSKEKVSIMTETRSDFFMFGFEKQNYFLHLTLERNIKVIKKKGVRYAISTVDRPLLIPSPFHSF